MIAKIKVLTNREEIEKAERTNQMNIAARAQQNAKPASKRGPEIVDVDVPKAIIEETELFLDAHQISLAHENELGMISILYNGQPFNLVKTDELMEQLRARFTGDCDGRCASKVRPLLQ